MKRILLGVMLVGAIAIAVDIALSIKAPPEYHQKMEAYSKIPGIYPLGIAYILAPFGVREAQTLVGTAEISTDPCKGANLLHKAAQQHQLFAESQIQGCHHVVGLNQGDREHFKKSFIWFLHLQSHFPQDKDESRAVVDMMNFTVAEEQAAREAFKAWRAEDAPAPAPPSCPGPFSFSG